MTMTAESLIRRAAAGAVPSRQRPALPLASQAGPDHPLSRLDRPPHVSATTYPTTDSARARNLARPSPTRPPPATLLHGLDSPRPPLLPPPLFIMVKTTLVVRASDALPLAASVDDEQVGAFPVLCVMAC